MKRTLNGTEIEIEWNEKMKDRDLKPL